ncbi:MAG TPA: gas vesicle protein GvpD P-loop domain-containing protein [Candidatus Deferrimicrobium sp.]|nr:gas vesicle protein GvpD P-loop domain-containing protein [Candidatus Deferrimicrobium sp.]
MSSIIPDELVTALNQSYGYILLIKGKAGTGKTTLALEILKIIKNPLYISTRIIPKFLYKQFPWIKEALAKENIIDATAFDFNSPISFNDEQSFLKSLRLQNLPDFMKILFSKMASMQKGTIVVDSWDAIVALGETRWASSNTILANYLIELVREKNFNLILILETDQEDNLDYLVDGIICLRKSLYENHLRVRNLIINKLRGVHIKQPSYLFTLNDGHFTTFAPTNLNQIVPPKQITLLEEKNSRFSSGIPDLDQLLGGGYRKGLVILHEVEPYLGLANVWFMMVPVIHFLRKERAVISVVPPGKNYTNEMQLLKGLVNNDKFFDQFFHYIELGDEATSTPNIHRISPTSNIDFFNNIRKIGENIPYSPKNLPFLFVISTNHFPLFFDLKEIQRETSGIIGTLKRIGQIYIFTAYSGDEYVETLKNYVDYHLKISQIDGKVVLSIKNPLRNLFAINFENSESTSFVKLIPIV